MRGVARHLPTAGCVAALVAFLLPVVERPLDGVATVHSGLGLAASGDPESLVAVMLASVVLGLASARSPLLNLRRACYAVLAIAFTLAATHGGQLLVGGWIAVGGLVVGGLPCEWLAGPTLAHGSRHGLHLASDAERRAS